MDGFITSVVDAGYTCSVDRSSPLCVKHNGPHGQPDVMGYHDAREIPNYWTWASTYMLQDHLFAPTDSWTLPSHLFLVSGWSASCSVVPPDELPVRRVLVASGDETAPRGDQSVLRLDRHHLSAARRGCELAVLRGGDLVREPLPRGRRLQRGAESFAVVHDGAPKPPTRQHRDAPGLPRRGANRHAAVGVVARPGQRSDQRAPRLGWAADRRTDLRHEDGRRRHAESLLGHVGDLPHVGRLGRVLRSRGATSSTSTVTACACPAS